MLRLPLLLLALATLAAACDASVKLPPTSTAARPTSVTVNRSSPDAAVRTFLDHLRAGDCDGVLDDLTAAERDDLIARGGGRDAVCRRISGEVSALVNSMQVLEVTTREQSADSASVEVRLRDSAGYVASDRFSLLREVEDWKIRQFVF